MSKPKAGFWFIGLFVLYCAVLAVTTARHESWFDEAQAWLMARDLTPFRLWTTYLRYEGTPGLWHTILMVPAKLGLPYGAMHVVSCLSAIAGTALLMWRSPFPIFVRALLPFTYFLMYQYAVIARSYSLLPLLFFLTAFALPRARQRPIWLIVILILMANVSVHGILAASGIFVVYMAETLIARKALPKIALVRHLVASAAWGVVLVLLAVQLWPPKDLSFPVASTRESIHASSIYTQIGEAFTVRYKNIDEIGQRVDENRSDARFARGMRIVGIVACSILLALSLFWFYKARVLLYFLLPITGVLLLSLLYHNRWHSGVLFLIWLFAMWIAAQKSNLPTPRYIYLVWILVLVPQLYWSAMTVAFDIRKPYSGSRAAADYLIAEGLAEKEVFAAGYEATSIQAYFNQNLFCNYQDGANKAFWFWSATNNVPEVLSTIPLSRPDVLIISLRTDDQAAAAATLERSLPQSGYRLGGRFDGELYWKSSVLESESFLVIRKDGADVGKVTRNRHEQRPAAESVSALGPSH